MDRTDGTAHSPASLRKLREWLEAERESVIKLVAALALRVPCAAVRFIVSTFMLTTDLPYPYVVDAALSYGRKQLAQSARTITRWIANRESYEPRKPCIARA
jgi:hypothetical protein